MSAKERQRRQRRTPVVASIVVGIASWLALALVVCAVACRSWFPSEDATSGTGVPVLLLELSVGPLLLLFWMGGGCGPRPGLKTIAWCLLLGLLGLSTWSAPYRFPAIVMAWEWLAVALVWLCVRQLSPTVGLQPWVVLMLGLTVGQCLAATWQVAVEFPEMRHRYERRDPSFLAQMAQLGVQPGTVEETRFRDRLYATEPYGAFGHPNTLAGFLVLGLPLVLLGTATAWTNRAAWTETVVMTLASLLVLTVLLLTKSRSAWLAALAALAVQLALSQRGWAILRTHAVKALTGLALLVVGLLAFGLLDRLVLTESLKSFRYRFEWWQASWSIICESPWLGVGFGNFASHYLAYKLPFSSEEIQDPHNFLIELWCCGGLLVMLTYLALLALSLREALCPGSKAPATDPKQRRESATRDSTSGTWNTGTTHRRGLPSWWWAGLLGAASVTVLLRPLGDSVPWLALIGGVLGVLLAGTVCAQTFHLQEPTARTAVASGVVALHVHWLAAGGIGYPGLLLPCWTLLGATRSDDTTQGKWKPGFGSVTIFALMSVLMLTMFVATLLLPTLRRDQILSRQRNRDQRSVSVGLRQAAEAMPGDQAGWVRLALWYEAQIPSAPQSVASAAYRQGVQAWQRAIELEPRRSANYRALGRLHNLAAERNLKKQARSLAVEALTESVRRYPNSAQRRFELGKTLWSLGNVAAAQRELAEALELDKTPHPDKKLETAQRQWARHVCSIVP